MLLSHAYCVSTLNTIPQLPCQRQHTTHVSSTLASAIPTCRGCVWHFCRLSPSILPWHFRWHIRCHQVTRHSWHLVLCRRLHIHTCLCSNTCHHRSVAGAVQLSNMQGPVMHRYTQNICKYAVMCDKPSSHLCKRCCTDALDRYPCSIPEICWVQKASGNALSRQLELQVVLAQLDL